VPTTKERLATLEAENDASKPHHEETSKSIGEINQRLTAIETTLKILVTNGRSKWRAMATPGAMGGGSIGLVWLALERFS